MLIRRQVLPMWMGRTKTSYSPGTSATVAICRQSVLKGVGDIIIGLFDGCATALRPGSPRLRANRACSCGSPRGRPCVCGVLIAPSPGRDSRDLGFYRMLFITSRHSGDRGVKPFSARTPILFSHLSFLDLGLS